MHTFMYIFTHVLSPTLTHVHTYFEHIHALTCNHTFSTIHTFTHTVTLTLLGSPGVMAGLGWTNLARPESVDLLLQKKKTPSGAVRDVNLICPGLLAPNSKT